MGSSGTQVTSNLEMDFKNILPVVAHGWQTELHDRFGDVNIYYLRVFKGTVDVSIKRCNGFWQEKQDMIA